MDVVFAICQIKREFLEISAQSDVHGFEVVSNFQIDAFFVSAMYDRVRGKLPDGRLDRLNAALLFFADLMQKIILVNRFASLRHCPSQ